MADKIPDHKFSPDQTPWARWAQKTIEDHDQINTQNAQAAANINQGTAAILQNQGLQLQAIERLQTQLQSEVDKLLASAVNTGDVNATGHGHFGADVSAGASLSGVDARLSGFVFSPAGRAFTTLTGFASAYFDGTGKLGINTSTVEHKQDMEPADTTDIVDALLHLALIRFRRIALVDEIGDDAPWELGTIAEYMAATALKEWTFDDADGATQGIDWAGLVAPLIATVQRLDGRIKDLELAA